MPLSLWEDLGYTLWPSDEQYKFKQFMKIVTNYFYKDEDLVQFDLAKNIDLVKKWTHKIYGTNPMHQAAHYGNTNLVKVFLDSQKEFNCYSNEVDDYGWSTLHHATHSTLSNYLKRRSAGWWTIERLIADGVDINHRNHKGESARDFLADCDRYLLQSYDFAERKALQKKNKHLDPSQTNYLLAEKKRLEDQSSQMSGFSFSPNSDRETLPIKICDLIKKVPFKEDDKQLRRLINLDDVEDLQKLLCDEVSFRNYLSETYSGDLIEQDLAEQSELSSSMED